MTTTSSWRADDIDANRRITPNMHRNDGVKIRQLQRDRSPNCICDASGLFLEAGVPYCLFAEMRAVCCVVALFAVAQASLRASHGGELRLPEARRARRLAISDLLAITSPLNHLSLPLDGQTSS